MAQAGSVIADTVVIQTDSSNQAQELLSYLEAYPQPWGEAKQLNIRIERLKNLIFVAILKTHKNLGIPDEYARSLIKGFLICESAYPIMLKQRIVEILGRSYSSLELKQVVATGIIAAKNDFAFTFNKVA